jgi:hypothetical protein
MNAVERFLTNLFTGLDNQTYDIARVLWAVSCLALIFYAGWGVIVNKQAFNAIDFGGGAAGVLAGGGIGVASKMAAEPRPHARTDNDPAQ